ncbi:hypothetical protein P8452_17450 [Trifolium repens]|nr:hypothetical protein P8452_17450 [Trifolium repens]
MEYSSAEMSCVLKVNTQCEACKVKVMQVLQKIRGVYTITIDGEEGTVKVTGRVNPNTLLSVLEKYGKHAQVKYVKFEGEVVERNSNYYGEYGYNPYDGMEYQGYYNPYYPHFSQPRPYPLPPVPYQFPPPPPSAGPFWAPRQPQPPAPPPVYGYGPPPSVLNLPPQHVLP